MCGTEDEEAVKEEIKSERRREGKEDRHTETEFISFRFGTLRAYTADVRRAGRVLQT